MSTALQITLSPEVAELIVREAARKGTSPEAVANETLRQHYAPAAEEAAKEPKNLAEALGPFIGAVHSGRGDLSQDCGEKLADHLVEKRQQGKL